MSKITRLFYKSITSTGLIYVVLALVLSCVALSVAQGYGYSNNKGITGLSGFDYFTAHINSVKLMFTNISFYFVTFYIFVFPLLPSKKTPLWARNVSVSELILSLPVSRKEYVKNSFINAMAISWILVVLFIIGAVSGIKIGKNTLNTESYMLFIRSWVFLMIVTVNVLAVLINAIYFSSKKHIIPILCIYAAIAAFCNVITPDMLYRVVTIPLFWLLLGIVTVVINYLCFTVSVRMFRYRDV